MRLTWRLAAMLAGLIASLPFHYLTAMGSRPSPWPRRYLNWVGRVAGMQPHIVGRPLSNHVLFVTNHLSWLDIVLVAGATGAAFVSKAEVARWPVIGRLARINNTIFVARTERRSVQGQADALRAALATGQAVALFPEGTTDGGRDVLPFRPSLLSALFPPMPGLKVQPVAIDYGEATEDIAWVGNESAAANARRLLSRRGTTPVVITFLDPLQPAAFADRKALADFCRMAIVEALGSGNLDSAR